MKGVRLRDPARDLVFDLFADGRVGFFTLKNAFTISFRPCVGHGRRKTSATV